MSTQLFLGKAQVSTRPALFLSKFEEIINPILKIDVISNRCLRKSFYVNKFLKCGKVQLFTSSNKGIKNRYSMEKRCSYRLTGIFF
ncbi:hypothetical protein BTA31_10085 [Bacillus haynesii]|uniref:Uncharacterized protein n=1 Tax=Bacillus haynesii TaxID=1925021 RepID=A0ABX3I5C7_9BACI|nr:hypothetical protein BTA31_10085 [Bacillus haynesii]